MYSFSTKTDRVNLQFHCKLYNMENSDDVKDYTDLFTQLANQSKTLEFLHKEKIQNDKAGTFFIYVEWLSFDLQKVSPYEGVSDE